VQQPAAASPRFYPNPTVGVVHVRGAGDVRKLVVFNITGAALLSINRPFGKQAEIDLGRFPAGTYLLQTLMANGTRYNEAIVKQ
jgi:hypothetical protein